MNFINNWQKYDLKTNNEFNTLMYELLIKACPRSTRYENGKFIVSGPILLSKTEIKLMKILNYYHSLTDK